MKASARAAGLAADEAPARCGNGPTGDFSAEGVHARDLRNQGGDRRRTCTANFLMSWMFQRRSPALATDCSVNTSIKGKTYCFSSQEAKANFMKNPTSNLD